VVHLPVMKGDLLLVGSLVVKDRDPYDPK